jgi:protein-L-isoaspartate(D-aspartate) O-methyltransferase
MERNPVDTYKHQGLRKKLVKDLEKKGSFDYRILDAISRIPRHFFLDSAFAEKAYLDQAFPIGEGQTISQPYTVAYQTRLLEVKPGDKILEIGTGSGYQAAVLATLGAKLYSIERNTKLSADAKYILEELKLNVKLYVGDGTLGLPKAAPFDKILVTAAAPLIPDTLLQQLKIGGYLVIPVGAKELQEMHRIIKTGANTFTTQKFETFRFVPLIGEEGW